MWVRVSPDATPRMTGSGPPCPGHNGPLLPASVASGLDAGGLQGFGQTLGHGKGWSPALTLAGAFRDYSLLIEALGAYPVVIGLAGLQVNPTACLQGQRLCSRGHPIRTQTRWDTAHIQEAAW